MKLASSIPSLLAQTSVTLLLCFAIPLAAPTFASNASSDCESIKPASLKTVDDFMNMGFYQELCLKDSQAAITSYTQAIKLDPKAEKPYYARASSYFMLGNYQNAVADFTEVINKNTGKSGFRSDAYFNRARAYEKLGEKRKAVSDLNQIINKSVDPDLHAHFLRANMYRDLGEKENAIADYKIADKILQQGLNGVFGSGLMGSMYEEMFNETRNNLSRLGVSLPSPQFTTRNLLQSLAKIEVDRVLNLARLNPQNPTIKQFDAQIQDLYNQLANTEPQPYKDTEKILISNAAYEKIQVLEKERSQLLEKFSSNHPAVVLIDNQKKQLKALMSSQ